MAGTARTTRTARPAPEPEKDQDEELFTDPAAGELDEDDLFDEDDLDDEIEGARSGYVQMIDLKDRLLLCRPSGIGTRESKTKGQDDYEYVINSPCFVLDGEETDMLDEIPFELEDYQLWGVNVVSTLKPKIRKGTWCVGRLKQRKAQGYSTLSWYLEEPDEDDFALAKVTLQKYKAAERAKAAKVRR